MENNHIQKLFNELIKRTAKQQLKDKNIRECRYNLSDECVKVGFGLQFKNNRKLCKECLKIINHNTYLKLKQKKELLTEKMEQ